MMIRGIKSSLIKLILAQINFAYILSISFVAFENQNLSAKREEEFSLCSYITKI